ncbi:MAG: hypothetical protein Kow0090_22420 [Myxococcota bacterium]
MKITALNDVFIRVHKSERALGDIWFIHGFGESSLSFSEAFSSVLCEIFNLYAPDLPGFGVSPFNPDRLHLADAIDTLKMLVREISGDRPLFIVGHSLGGILGTWLSKHLEAQVKGYVSIEGNLTKADTFGTSLTNGFDDPDEFYRFLLDRMYKLADGSDLPLQRYFASLRLAHPKAMLAYGKECVVATGETKAGREYIALKCPTLYFWGDKSTPERTKLYIEENNINNLPFQNCGHWLMIDNPKRCYSAIREFFINFADGSFLT